MEFVRNIGYLVTALLAVAVISVAGLVMAVLGVLFKAILLVGSVVLLVAFGIKEYCESKPDRTKPGER
jgi:hypothetical protein